jgi:hypothetical protein
MTAVPSRHTVVLGKEMARRRPSKRKAGIGQPARRVRWRSSSPPLLLVFALASALCLTSVPAALGFGFITKWGRYGTHAGQFTRPPGLATDGAGHVYVLGGHDRVEKFTGRGAFLMQWGSTGRGRGQMRGASGIATDRAGHVYVADQGNNRIDKFSAKGVILAQWGHAGSGRGEFRKPVAVATDRVGHVYVVDQGNRRVVKLSAKGVFLTQWNGAGPDRFIQPATIATDGLGNIYVGDLGGSTPGSTPGGVSKFTKDGKFVLAWRSVSVYPGGIAVNRAGQVFVSNDWGPEFGVKVYTSTGDYLSRIGGPGEASGQFISPGGLAFDARGDLYVADGGNSRVQKFGEPSTAFSLDKKLTTDSNDGTARLIANLPGVGGLDVSGAQIKSGHLSVKQAGRLVLAVTPSEKTRARLEAGGRVAVTVNVTYRPSTPGASLSATRSKRVTLVEVPSLTTARLTGAVLKVRVACLAGFTPLCRGRVAAVTAKDRCERRDGRRICHRGTPMTTSASVRLRPTESTIVTLRVKSEFRPRVAQLARHPGTKSLLIRQAIHAKGFKHGRPQVVYRTYGVQAGK